MESALLAALFGLLVGSFLNVCISRLPQDLSVVVPRSYCPRCAAPIHSWDNIPVVSYLFLRGRCRACRLPISPRYPLVELSTGALFFIAIQFLGLTWAGATLCLFSALLVALIVTDLEWRILPDEFTKGGAILGLFLSPIALLPESWPAAFWPALPPPAHSFIDALVGGAIPALGLWSIGSLYQWLRRREGLGLGDVKLILMTGAFLGLEANLAVLILGSLSGSVLGLSWIFARRKDPSSYELPFGLFLGGSALAIAFWRAKGMS
jgi:leader peptidase (prepilin peptidase)/N-methyltransferase